MTKVAKRFLIGGAVGAAALLTVLGLFAFKAAEELTPAGNDAKPAPVAAALAVPDQPQKEEPAPKPEASPSAAAADLANAFGAALGVEVKDSPKKSGGSAAPTPSTPAQAAQASTPSRAASTDTLDLGSKKERNVRFGDHTATPTGIRAVGGQEKSGRAKSGDDKITFETQLK